MNSDPISSAVCHWLGKLAEWSSGNNTVDRGSGSERMEVGNAVQRLVLGCLLTVFAGCGSGELDMSDGQSAQSADERPQEHAENAAKKTHVGSDVPMLEQWSHSCALCHVDGMTKQFSNKVWNMR